VSLSARLQAIAFPRMPPKLDTETRIFLEGLVRHIRELERELTAKNIETAIRADLDKYLVPIPPDRDKDFVLAHDESEIGSNPGTPSEQMRAIKWIETTTECAFDLATFTADQKDLLLYHQTLDIANVT